MPVKHAARWLTYAMAAVVALACALLLAVRYVVLPAVESHREWIAAWIARELKLPVEIDAIVTGWDGWNPEIAVQGLRVRDAAGAVAVPLIELPGVTGVVSWTSLLFGELRLKELTIERPRLAIRRDTAGRLHLAGLEIDPEGPDLGPTLPDWLLKQRLIVVRGGLLAWNDDLRNAPQLILDRVDFRLESRFGHHRFGLTGTPPADVAAPIDLRGEAATPALSDWRLARGRVYLRLDYANVAAWAEWLPLPVDVAAGIGALRMWFDFEEGVVREIVADVELADVRARLARDLPPLDVDHLAGRLSWLQHGAERRVSARSLAVDGRGIAIAPTDLTIRYTQHADGKIAAGRATVSQLDLAPLATLAAHLPLPETWRRHVVRLAPRGALTATELSWEGTVAEPTAFRAVGTMLDVGFRAQDALPGMSNVSGAFEATQAGGTLRVGSRNVRVELPRVFPGPLALDAVSGRVRWEHEAGRIRVRFEDVEYANAHAAGTLQGTWKSAPKGPGEADLQARLTRADLGHVYDYLPFAIQESTRVWVRDSLKGGVMDEATLSLKGDLARFPFPQGRGGTFQLVFKGRDGVLDYANGWPVLSGVDTEVRFENEALRIAAPRGRILGAALARTTATIPDVLPPHPTLVIEGEASGPTAEFLQFIERSPVAAWIDRFTDGAQASGQGRLAMRIEMTLGGDQAAQVKGDYQFADNQLRLPGLPALSRINGRIAFTEREMSGRDITLEAFGASASVNVAAREGVVRVDGRGSANLAALRSQFASPWTDRVSGKADVGFRMTARPTHATFVVDSDLRGATVDLPPPFGKAASETVPFRLERRLLGDDGRRDALIAEYGSAVRVVAHRTLDARQAVLDRALVSLGKAAAKGGEPSVAGIVVRGDVPLLDLDQWLALGRSVAGRDPSRDAPPQAELRSVDLCAAQFIAFGRRYDDMAFAARSAADGWRIALDGRQVAGTARWESPDARARNGRFSAQLKRLDLFGAHEMPAQQKEAPRDEGSPNPWPEVDVVAERFFGRSGVLGRLEVAGRPDGADWRVTRLAIVNEAGRIDADGSWRARGRVQESRFDVAVDVKDAPGFLARMGLPHDIKGAATTIEGQVAWPGAPTDFEYATLSGTFRLQVGAGQFTKMDPGVGRLLGVVSLQALPRRITLDFRDVFSEGFAFDSVTGSVRITNGVMHTDSLQLVGPAAKVRLAGDVDLAAETQTLNVRVQPSLSTAISTGAGAAAVVLLAANPLVGAAVGAGTLLAQKLMQDPIEQMFSYEYAVRGGWSEPVVERIGMRVVQPLGTQAESGFEAAR